MAPLHHISTDILISLCFSSQADPAEEFRYCETGMATCGQGIDLCDQIVSTSSLVRTPRCAALQLALSSQRPGVLPHTAGAGVTLCSRLAFVMPPAAAVE